MAMNPQLVVARAAELEIALIQSGGEITPDIDIAMRALAEDVDSTAMTLDRIEAAVSYWKKERDKASAVARGLERLSERLETTIKGEMRAKELTEMLGETTRFKLSPCPKRLVIDDERLDPSYKIQVTTLMPDKERIKRALESGETVIGAELTGGVSLRTYPNRTTLPR